MYRKLKCYVNSTSVADFAQMGLGQTARPTGSWARLYIHQELIEQPIGFLLQRLDVGADLLQRAQRLGFVEVAGDRKWSKKNRGCPAMLGGWGEI